LSATLTILDVGHGNSAILKGDEGVLIIDAGPGGGDLLQYLFDEGICRVDCLVISHADDDHLRGLLALLEDPSIEIGEVRVNPDAARLTELWQDISWSLAALDREKRTQLITACVDGDVLPSIEASVEICALAPVKELALHGPGWTDPSNRTANSNSCSVVLRVTFDGEHVALIPGDLDLMGLDYTIGAHEELNASVLVFPHHGGNTDSKANRDANVQFTNRLLEIVQPQAVIFSIGRGRHGTPRPEIVAAVRAFGADIRIACTQMSEHCRQDSTVQSLDSHLLDIQARGRTTNSCCAGSLRLDLGGNLAPGEETYEAFKLVEAPTALCR
jgi:beta-lactamase superfamily II metal-dependent hydrolase